MTSHERNMLIVYPWCNRGGVCSVIAQRVPLLLTVGWQVDAVFRTDYGGRDELIKAGVRRIKLNQQSFEKEASRSRRKCYTSY